MTKQRLLSVRHLSLFAYVVHMDGNADMNQIVSEPTAELLRVKMTTQPYWPCSTWLMDINDELHL